MKKGKFFLYSLIVIALIFNLIFLVILNINTYEEYFFGEIEIHFIDVGQADSTLIKTNNSKILIDVGHWQRNDVLEYLKNINVNKIDLLVGTHPHADHIGQMDIVIENLIVGEIWMSGHEQDSETYRRVHDSILESDAKYREPRTGEEYLVEDILIEILNPEELNDDIHENSLSFKVSFGELSIMFTGDAEKETELEMIEENQNIFLILLNKILPSDYEFENNLEVDIYQLGHHGSQTSSTREFLEVMNPKIGIYSAGKENRYGHPHEEVVERFEDMGIPLYGTDEYGTIIIEGNSKGEFEIFV